MRIVTWNCCRGAYSTKRALLEVLSPDIAVMQECARPAVESETCLWFGDNPNQGIVVTATPPYKLRALPRLEVPKFVMPVEVTGGPEPFTLLAVWSKTGQEHRYVRGVVKAVQAYRSLFEASPTVLLGDLNSNVIWNHEHPADLNHGALVALLSDLGLVSSYHHFFSEPQGRETRPTYYFQWNQARSFHIDYCFIPRGWAQRLRTVEVGSYESLKGRSDHRPLLVEVSPSTT